MKLKDLMLLVICGVLLWFLTFEMFVLKNVGRYLDIFQNFDASVDIKNFFKKAPVLQDRLFLIDKRLLRVLEKNPLEQNNLFCNAKKYNPIAFALLYPANSSLQEHLLLPILKAWEIGFWVETIISSKPKKFSMYHANLPLGFILRKGDGALVIEIVLLHEREGDFWWHGSFYQDIHYEMKLTNLKLFDKKDEFVLSEEGALDKFRVKSINVDNIKLNIPNNVSLFVKEETKFIECNYELADKYYRTFGKDTTPRALRFIHKARKILIQAKFILDELQIPFWISSGTLLGYYRQCDIIPYSRDVDIGIFTKDHKNELIKKFKLNQLKLKHIFGKIEDSYELSFVFANLKLDIFFFYDDGKFYWNGAHFIKKINDTDFVAEKYKYSFPKFTLCWTEFLDLKVRIPCDTETYIRANYGPDWFTPLPNWNWVESPFNVEKVGEWRNDDILQPRLPLHHTDALRKQTEWDLWSLSVEASMRKSIHIDLTFYLLNLIGKEIIEMISLVNFC